MSDFSLFSLFTAGLACLVPLTAAYTQPKGDAPKGNPISQPGLNSVVPVGKPFTITWDPTTKGTVTLVLLKGPSSNAVPQYPIVEKTPNDGSYVWTPSADLAPTDNAMGYGIQLIDDANGQYQYTTQFGISNPDYKKPKSSEAKSSPAKASKTSSEMRQQTTNAPQSYTSSVVKDYTTYCSEATTFAVNNQTYTVKSATTLTITDCSCTITKPVHTAPYAPVGTGHMSMSKPHNVTMVAPTAYAPSSVASPVASSYNAPAPTGAVPASNSTGAPTVPQSTGGASGLAASFVSIALAAGVAVLAL